VRDISRLTRWSRAARTLTGASHCAGRDSCAVDRNEDGRLMIYERHDWFVMKQAKQHQAASKTTTFRGWCAAWPYKLLTDQLRLQFKALQWRSPVTGNSGSTPEKQPERRLLVLRHTAGAQIAH